MSTPSTPTGGAPTAPQAAPSTTPESSVGDVATQQAQTEISPDADTASSDAAEAAAEKVAGGQKLSKEEKQELKKWLLKANGKAREVTDESELVRLAQLGLGAHEKFEQAAQTRKKAEAILEILQRDPAKAMKELGHDVRKLAEDYLAAEAQKMMMSEEERQKFEISQEIERLKSEKEELLRQQREERITQLQAKYEADIQDQIISAIDKYKLPKNPKTVARIAEYMASALENGYEASPLDVAPRVRTDLEEEHKSLFNHYTVEDLLKLLGDDKLKEIRQYEIQKVKAKAPATPIKTEPVAQPKVESDEKPNKKSMTMDELQSELFNKYLK